jgi:RNA polymerase sigma-70 factor, ECF subfamily
MVAHVDSLTRLARRAVSGDVPALEALAETAYEPVWRFCGAFVGEQAADDLTQETFFRMVRALPDFRGDSSALTWLLAIARHVCLDEIRARSRRRRRDAVLAGAGRGAVAEDASVDVAVADLISHLDEDRRAAFVLTQLLGLSYDEAARVCACPTGTIRSRVARARAELISLVHGSDHEGPSRLATRGPSTRRTPLERSTG